MSVLWNAADAAAATGGTTTADWAATGVSIDTRELLRGDLFVALKDVRDGHEFVAAALSKGAAAALVTHRPDGVGPDAPLLIVPDVLTALEHLGIAARARTQAKVIGVTGSVGKTGTKEMLRTALESQGDVHAAVRSFNNHWGVPLTLARMPAETDFAIIEIGMNHPGEIGPLAKMAGLDVAVVTTVAAVHMAAFRDVDQIACAKAEIFEGLRAEGTAVLNCDIDTFGILQNAAQAVVKNVQTFGTKAPANYRLISAHYPNQSTVAQVQHHGKDLVFKLGAPGAHLAMNALAVLAAVEAVDADVARSALALAHWTAPSGRGQRYVVHLSAQDDMFLELIDESYNANPTSMQAALAVLAGSKPSGFGAKTGRRVAFLGDMLELGPNEHGFHADLANVDSMSNIDVVHTSGPLMKSLHDALPLPKRGTWYPDATAMAATVRTHLEAGDVAMVKGSLGSQVGKVVAAIKALEKRDIA